MAGGSTSQFDLVVVGGGMGGLTTAALAQYAGLQVCLAESHTKLGGCAGYFDRGVYTFDAGATALMGVAPGEPIGDLLEVLGVDFEAHRAETYRVHLPDRQLDITSDATTFEQACANAFPGRTSARTRFWRFQEFVGQTLFQAASKIPRLPIHDLSDLIHNLRILGPAGTLAASTCVFTVLDILRILRLADDTPFRTLIAMLLQDTAQAGPETVPFANAAACLHAYRLGMSRPRNGMAALVDGIGHRFAMLDGDLRTATLVDHVDAHPDGGFVVTTRRGAAIRTAQVAFNIPLDRAAALLGQSLDGRLARKESRSRAAWSAFTGYLAIDRAALDDSTPLFHQVLGSYDLPIHDGNNVLISLSAPDDMGYGPANVRIATMSTHTRPHDWAELGSAAHGAKKAQYTARMRKALSTALPGAADAIVHAEFATPRSFQRFTRRKEGAVGGPPVSRQNSNFLAVGSDVFGPGLWVVGDSVFPGQGTMATVLSGIRVVERITGIPWAQMKSGKPPLPPGSPAYNSGPLSRRSSP